MLDVERPYSNPALTTADAHHSDVAQSGRDAADLDKVLNHLAGRVQVLKSRLESVLLPAMPTPNGQAQGQPSPPRSTLALLCVQYRGIAESALDDVEDMLNRLDL